MKLKIGLGVDVSAYAEVEMNVAVFNLEHVKRSVSKMVDDGLVRFQVENPEDLSDVSGLRITDITDENDEHLAECVVVDRSYYDFGQEAAIILGDYYRGRFDAEGLIEALRKVAIENCMTLGGALGKLMVDKAIAKTEATAPDWTF